MTLKNATEPEIAALEVLYVGNRRSQAARELEAQGARLSHATSVYEAIARLKRWTPGATVVEFARLGPTPSQAVEELRTAGERRPLFVSMSQDEWETLRGAGWLAPEEVLLRPLYPDELARRLRRQAFPPPSAATVHFRNEAQRLQALMEDLQKLLRLKHDLPRISEQLVKVAEERLQATRVSLFLQEPRSSDYQLAHAVGLKRALRDVARCRMGEGIAGRFAQGRQVVLVKQAGSDGPATERDYKSGSYLIAPIVHQREVLGILCATERLDGRPFSPQDAAYLEALCETAAQILHGAMQYRAADELATIDPLTGLFNRRHFDRVLPQEIQRARRYKHDLTLAMVDVDHFKAYNDYHGHQAGDRALQTVARILRETLRQSDIVVRYGGEEFVVLMPETTREPGNGVESVDRARRRVEEAGLAYVRDGVQQPLTISAGVATWRREPEETAEELVRRADELHYRAKNTGRNRVIGD